MAKKKPASKPAKKSPAKRAAANSKSSKAATKKSASPKKKAKKASSTKSDPVEAEATIDRRRDNRREAEASGEGKADAPPKLERRKKVNRRRQIDPTTCERDYSDAEVEFMNALDDYKRASGRMFPTCSEVLEVIRGLGYVQLSPAEVAANSEAAAGGDDDTLDADAEAQARDALTLSAELTPAEEPQVEDLDASPVA